MKHRLSILLCLIIALFSSCIGIAPTAEVQLTDYYNQRAYAVRYQSLDSLGYYSHSAYKSAKRYKLGKAQACNNLGFHAFMKMDFEGATRYFNEVFDYTINELELLIADIGLMKITQRTASNKSFYDYRNRALKRMKRIDEDLSVFESPVEKERLNYAYSEFHIVSAIYFYYLQQQELALESIQRLDNYKTDAVLWGSSYTDLNQLLYFKYIRGATGLITDSQVRNTKLASFDELFQTWSLANELDATYFEGNAAQGMANILVRPSDYQLLYDERSLVLSNLGFQIDSLLPLKLGNYALNKFKKYDDLYQIAGAYVTLGKYYNYREQYSEALDVLTKALDCVNKHHQKYYKDHHTTPDNLLPFVQGSDRVLELEWIEDEVLTVPDWISRIREQLSVTYAGLGNKEASDYNRNIYLDILDLVRQDKELEGRFQDLQKEERLINSLLALLFTVLLLFILLVVFVNRRSRKRTALYLSRLERSLTVCRELTASLPVDSKALSDIVKPIGEIVYSYLNQELGVVRLCIDIDGDESIQSYDSHPSITVSDLKETSFLLTTKEDSPLQGVIRVYREKILSREERSFVAVLSPYMVWAIENGLHFMDLGEEQDVLEKRRFITNQHNIDHKRENIMKRACMRVVYGIQPYIDRILNEVDIIQNADYALDDKIRQSKYDYIIELLETIDEYNKVLAHWIKIKQGDLTLDITNFDLGELFDLVSKGARPFEQKGVAFTVKPTSVYLKADRALTLFMINTLVENGRKFTPKGGEVQLYATEYDKYVEISVSDTGVGISSADVSKILGEKVYDSSEIGATNKAVSENKGGGFGLMNCKAIIEEYRKANPLFSVCSFSIDSQENKGSRFSFRLPYGVKKTLLLLLILFVPFVFTACSSTDNETLFEDTNEVVQVDTVRIAMLQEASDYADAAYYSNVDQKYEQTLYYVDLARQKMNDYYLKYTYHSMPLLKMVSNELPAEVAWWNQQFYTNYHIILDIRNEAAVAYLALKDIDAYNYNNNAYTTLYKLISKDDTLDKYCKALERSTSNKRVGLVLLSLLVISFIISYYLLYVRRQLVRRWSLEQVLSINERIFSASLRNRVEEGDKSTEKLDEIPVQILHAIYSEINELLAADAVGISLINEEKQELFTTIYPTSDTVNSHYFEEAISQGTWLTRDLEEFVPLEITLSTGGQKIIGVLYLKRRDATTYQEERLFIGLIARYLSIVLYNSMIRTAGRFRDIEMVFDEMHRLAWENSQIHVQNRVLDNCLSALKHETIYYPSRLKQVVSELKELEVGSDTEIRERASMVELIEYYKGLYTILSLWAKKELERITFRRTTLSIDTLTTWITEWFDNRSSRLKSPLTLEVEAENNLEIVGDEKLVYYLVELLTSDALHRKGEGELRWTFAKEGEFVRFCFSDSRGMYETSELNKLFYPKLTTMEASTSNEFQGSTFLIAKEIIREHDEYVGRRGCRIWITPQNEGGYTICFTLAHKANIRG